MNDRYVDTLTHDEMYVGEVEPIGGWLSLVRCPKCLTNMYSNGIMLTCHGCGHKKRIKNVQYEMTAHQERRIRELAAVGMRCWEISYHVHMSSAQIDDYMKKHGLYQGLVPPSP